MLATLKPGDVLWTLFQQQWIRVVVDHVFPPGDRVAVRALFPGDSRFPVWAVDREHLQTDEPSFDQLDAVDDGDFEFA